jgi:hypothetical protein
VEECGSCPVFASFFTLAFALQLREKHGKTTVRVRETSVRLLKTSVRVQYTYYKDTHALQNRHKHTHYKTHTQTHTLQNPHIRTHTHTHTHTHLHPPLLNNIRKPPQYNLKRTQYKIYPNEYNNTQFGTVVAVTY